MPQARWLLAFAVIVIGALALVGATLGGRNPSGASAGPSSATDGSGPSPTSTSSPSGATATATQAAPSAQAAPSTTAAPAATRRPAATPARATGDPRLAYAEFLLRVNDDRSTVDGLNRTLAAAAEAGDPDAVRPAAVAILDFVDIERDWLRGHPPAECYAAAHDAATTMLDAYGTAAERFVDWTAAGGGLDGLAALGQAADAAQAAGDALAAFGTVLETTRCPA
jgi:hypothetical protein